MYVWFSHCWSVWYRKDAEESVYNLGPKHGAWWALFVANIVLNWLGPFVILLRRDTKRQRKTLRRVAVMVLVGRWVDVYLMIFPAIVGEVPRLGLWEIGLTAGGIGCFGLVLTRILRGAPAVPVADPQLAESLRYEH